MENTQTCKRTVYGPLAELLLVNAIVSENEISDFVHQKVCVILSKTRQFTSNLRSRNTRPQEMLRVVQEGAGVVIRNKNVVIVLVQKFD